MESLNVDFESLLGSLSAQGNSVGEAGDLDGFLAGLQGRGNDAIFMPADNAAGGSMAGGNGGREWDEGKGMGTWVSQTSIPTPLEVRRVSSRAKLANVFASAG